MATTEIVRVPVDDSEFTRFTKAFGDYRERLKEMPADWQRVNARIGEFAKTQQAAGVSADKAWANATKAAMDYERAVKQATKANQHLGGGITNAASAMKKMAAEGKALSGHLFGAVKFATKLATFGLGGSLVGVAAGGFGLDALAGNVLNTQKTAKGLGLTSGQYNSFRLNMQRYVGGGVLSGAAEAQMNQGKWGYLATLGISPQRAAFEPATNLAEQEMMAVHRAWKQNPTMSNAQLRSAMALGFSTEDIRRLGLAHGKNLQAAFAAYNRGTGSLGFSNQVAREWSAFKIAMDKAGTAIETSLVKTLVPLTPQLTKLSREISDMIIGLEKSGTVKEWVNDLAGGLKAAAQWLGSPAFKQDMRTIAYDFDALAKKLGWLVEKVVGKPGKPGVNNPGNLMDSHGNLKSFASQAAGIRAMFGREERYPKEYGTKTAAEVFAKYKGPWAGPGDMTTAQYQQYIAKHAGINLNAPLPYNDYKKMSEILHWQTVAEGHGVPAKAIYADLMSAGRTVPNNIITRLTGTAGHHADIPDYVAIHDARVRAIEAQRAEQAHKTPSKRHTTPHKQSTHITIHNNTSALVHMGANAAF